MLRHFDRFTTAKKAWDLLAQRYSTSGSSISTIETVIAELLPEETRLGMLRSSHSSETVLATLGSSGSYPSESSVAIVIKKGIGSMSVPINEELFPLLIFHLLIRSFCSERKHCKGKTRYLYSNKVAGKSHRTSVGYARIE
ncbi:hypothetical protein M569_00095 [Genlisea aurea]|uniref:Uncharacterized protein n=1 Tax=Genlisea aurea TaxID=192259 RepID=S8D4H3_9LAMI|nr:hypothetical protein M569_00095 [Genlisea aurea]